MHTTNPSILITVIIPTFNRSKFLRRAIESVLQQTYQDRCILVMDNNSSDDTSSIVNEYIISGAKIKYKCNEENVGALQNIIRGVNAIESDYYCVLCDDDFLLPKFMEEVIVGFDDPDVMFSCAKTLVADLPRGKIYFRNTDWTAGFYLPSNRTVCKMFSSHFTTTGVVFRREVSDLIGPFDVGGTDVLYTAFAAASFKFYIADHYGAVFTIHNISYTNSGGVGAEGEGRLFELVALSVAEVLKLQLTNERKTLLTKLVLDYYMPILRSNACSIERSFLKNKSTDEMSWRYTPVSKYELIIGTLKMFPKFLSPLVLKLAKCVESVLRKRTEKWYHLNGQNITPEISSTLATDAKDFAAFGKWIAKHTAS
jgi:glycosyltransferase involved in cell wall biosynthesis